MIKVDLLNSLTGGMVTLAFELSVEAESPISISDIYFNLDTNNNLLFRIPCSKNMSILEAKIQEKMISLLNFGEEYSCFLEVIIDERIFIPLRDTISFISPPRIAVSSIPSGQEKPISPVSIGIVSRPPLQIVAAPIVSQLPLEEEKTIYCIC